MSDTSYIYALVDPRTGLPRYVGKTNDLMRRMRRHRNTSGSEHKSIYRNRWIAGLQSEGLDFQVWILEMVEGEAWVEAERRWIKTFRDEGCRLTNLTDGGDGFQGYVWSEESKQKLRKPKADGVGEKISAGLKRYIAENPEAREMRRQNGLKADHLRTPEAKRKSAEATRRFTSTPEHSAKLKAAVTPERRIEMSRIATKNFAGVPKSPEWKAKAAETARNRPLTACEICGRKLSSNNMVVHLRAHGRRGEMTPIDSEGAKTCLI